ncbi:MULTISPECIES: YwqG family protein [unclassified Micromonospora]|uniref:YwqG family protein n=1 Tax=unclassified Micromonospora TaxID=2617518 RepID=UPI003333A181
MTYQQEEIELAKDVAVQAIQKSAFSSRGKEFLLSKLAYTLLITTSRTDDADIPIGTSKFGGLPDLPSHLDWPTYDCSSSGKTPMCFVGQIHLPDVKPYDYHQVLPERGWLYFFDSVVDGISQVHFYEGDQESLQRTNLPDELEENILEIFDSCTLRFRPAWDLPGWRPEELDLDFKEHEYIGIDDIEFSGLYSKLREEVQGNRYSHQMFGYCWSWDDVEDHLLLLVETDKNANMMWGDSGCMHYMIKPHQLAQKRFDQVESWMYSS